MSISTADLCDEYIDRLRVLEPVFSDFGARTTFSGEVITVKVFEDNVLVRQILEEEGKNRVLVVDGGGSQRCALLGDRLAALAEQNGWGGLVIYGCIRDSEEVTNLPVGIKALNVSPVKSIQRGEGKRQVQVHFAGVTINPGDFLYADKDGIVVAKEDLR